MAVIHKAEVEAIRLALHSRHLIVRPVLENELLQMVERAFMIDLLTHLHKRVPGMRRERLLAVRALQRLHDRLDDQALLQNGAFRHLPLYRELQLETPRMLLSVNEGGVDQLNLSEALHPLEADRKELSALKLGLPPLCTLQVPVALRTPGHSDLPANPLRDVDFGLHTPRAEHRRVRLDRRGTLDA